MSKIKLFCFPYAGGSSQVFNNCKPYLDPAIELLSVELSGRGGRMNEPLYKDLSEAVGDVFQITRETIGITPYALLGHSMGGLIAYGLAQKIRDHGLPPPLHIFFSGRSAPHIKREENRKFHLMEYDEFKQEVLKLGGTPPGFFEQPELLELFLPILKNDFKIAETEMPDEDMHPLDQDITVFLGKDDDLTSEQCDGWKKHTRQLCSIHYFEGGHFFLYEKAREMMNLINNILLNNIPLRSGRQNLSSNAMY